VNHILSMSLTLAISLSEELGDSPSSSVISDAFPVSSLRLDRQN
jgi:hypothetical protein